MIRHIVMFSAKPEQTEAVFNGLKMLETIKGNWTLTVSKNRKLDAQANDIDVVVYGEFPDEIALQTYKSHPIYEQCTKTVQPLRNTRVAVDVAV